MAPQGQGVSGFGKLDWGDWLYGLIAGFVGGGANAVFTGVAVNLYDGKDWNLHAGKLYGLIFTVFLVNGIMNMMSFLRSKPLPAMKEVTTTVERTTVTKGPQPATIVQAVKETHLEPIDHKKKV